MPDQRPESAQETARSRPDPQRRRVSCDMGESNDPLENAFHQCSTPETEPVGLKNARSVLGWRRFRRCAQPATGSDARPPVRNGGENLWCSWRLVVALVISGLHPKDRQAWFLKTVFVGVPILIATQPPTGYSATAGSCLSM